MDGPRIQICGQRFFVEGRELFMKGINWSPYDRGTSPNFGQAPNFAGRVNRDAEMMAAIGVNVVKLYNTCTDMAVLDALHARGIYVIQPLFNFWDMNGDGRFTDADLNAIDSSIRASTRNGAIHPAIVMWSVGNEWNYNGFYNDAQWGNGHCWNRDGNGGGPPATYACPQAIDAAIAAFERVKRIDDTVPLSTIWGEVPSRDIAERIDPLIDVWASNVYRFNAFGNPPNQIIEQYRALTNKPFFIGEYGCDAWNTNIGRVDEAAKRNAIPDSLRFSSTIAPSTGAGHLVECCLSGTTNGGRSAVETPTHTIARPEEPPGPVQHPMDALMKSIGGLSP